MADPVEQKYAHLEDPGIRDFMIEGERLYPADAVNFTMAEQRRFYDQFCARFSKPHPAGLTVSDHAIGTIRCRRYAPAGASGATLLYLHGGGFVLGGIASHDSICGDLAAASGTTIVAVEYRLAPEHPFPAAFDDCWQVLLQVLASDGRVVLAGDSAGGNLAAALAIKARDEEKRGILGQVLIYPGLGGDMTTGSYVTQKDAPGLSTADVIYYRNTYRGGGSKFAEPLRETDFRNLPPAFLVAAGLDPLHDDSLQYAARLHAAGVSAEIRDEPLLVHAFLRARYMSRPAAESFAAIAVAVRQFAQS